MCACKCPCTGSSDPKTAKSALKALQKAGDRSSSVSTTGRQQSSRVLFRAVAAMAYDDSMSSESDDDPPSPIHEAAHNADVETLRRLLLEGESPDRRGHSSFLRTPLHTLCAGFHDDDTEDRVACLRLLVDAGANLDAACRLGFTALHRAAQYGNTAIVSSLLVAGANVNEADCIGWTALHRAARGRDRESTNCVEVLLAAGASVNVRDYHGNNPLDIAIIQDHRRAWPLLLRAGAEIPTNETDPYLVRVRNAGGFQRYEQAHITRITAILAPTPRLPPEMTRKIVEFWLHAGYY